MLSHDNALQMIQDSLSSLQRVGMIEEEIGISSDTVLLGTGSQLDSVGFVTFVADLEERLNSETNEEHYLVLDEITEFTGDNPSLSADGLAGYIEKLTGAAVS